MFTMPKSTKSTPIRTSGPQAYGPISIRSLAAAPRRGPEVKWSDVLSENIQLYHNASNGTTAGAVPGLFTLTTLPPTGTTATTRIGDRVFINRIDVKLWLSCKGDRPNVMFRVVAALLPGYTAGGPTSAWSTYTGSTANCLIASPSPDLVAFRYDKVVNPDVMANTIYPSANVARERSYYHTFSIPINENVSVNANNVIDTSNLVLFVVAYDAFGSLATDNIASMAVRSRVWFTDA